MGPFRKRDEEELKREEEEERQEEESEEEVEEEGSEEELEEEESEEEEEEEKSEETKRKRISESEEEEEEESDEIDLDPFPKSMSEDLKNEIIRYKRELNEGGPYKIDFLPNYAFLICVCPIDPIKHHVVYERVQTSLQLSIDQYNEGKDSTLVLDNIVRANRRLSCGGYLYYITFEATNTNSGQKDVYCTKVMDDMVDEVMTVEDFFKESERDMQLEPPIRVMLV